MRIVPALGGGGRTLVSFAGQSAGAPAWSPDSRRLAVATRGTGRLVIVDVKTGERVVASRAVGPVVELAWSPDSSKLLVGGWSSPGTCASLWLVEAATGQGRLLLRCR